MIALVQTLGSQPLFDSLIGHINAVDIESTIGLRFESVLILNFGRISNIGWIFCAALEFHSDDGVGEGLRLEDLDRLFDGFYADADVIGM